MKLALITRYWLESPGGGIREYNKNLIRELENQGVETFVIFIEGKDKDNYQLSSNKRKFAKEALEVLQKENPDVILCQDGWFCELPAVRYRKRNKDCKILVLFHTSFESELSPHKKLINNHLVNKFDRVGFVSKGLEENVKEIAGLNIKCPTFILYAGAKVKEPKKRAVKKFKEEFGLEDGHVYLLGLGLTSLPGKRDGAKLLMDSLKLVIKEYPNVFLVLTREGKFVPELKKYATERGIRDHIIFTGDVDDPYAVIEACDIYSHITFSDGLPIALLEVMAFGKPIVASNLFGMPEAIENGKEGILVENNKKVIVKALRNVISDMELQEKLGKAARKRVESQFTWNRTALNLLELVGGRLK